MLLINAVCSVDKDIAVTESVVGKHWPTANENGVSPIVLIELAAQTAGVCNGLAKMRTEGEGASVKGWLVGIKKANFFLDAPIAFGVKLLTKSENRHEFDLLREVFCTIQQDENVLGEVILQLIQAG